MKRNEIPEQYKWKMEDLYASNDAWETDFLKLTKGLEDLKAFEGTLKQSAEQLLKLMEKNDELGQLERAIEAFCDVLAPKGRLCVITFHSLEDRIVKDIIAKRVNPCTCPKEFPVCICGKKPDIKKMSGKPIVPSPKELEVNPRSRSAKLRIAEKK